MWQNSSITIEEEMNKVMLTKCYNQLVIFLHPIDYGLKKNILPHKYLRYFYYNFF